jgi:hypothetical protein
MKRSLLVLISICCLWLLSGCSSGPSTQTQDVATHLSVVAATSAPTAGVPFNITVTAVDSAGRMVAAYSGTVKLTSSSGQAVQPASGTVTGGTGTFSVTLNTPGPQTITVTDMNSLQGSSAITVGDSAPTHFSIAAAIYAATIGTPYNFTVTAADALGNTVTSYSGTVHFTTSDRAAVPPADATLTNGVGTFSITLKSSGGQTITATDKVSNSINGTSNVIYVSGPATHFSVANASGSAATRSPITLFVVALDASNNESTAYAGTVRITSSTDNDAILPAPGLLHSGEGNFQITLETAGNESVTATDTVTASVTGTGSIGVTATAALAITSGAPPPGTVGSAYGPTRTEYLRCTSFPLQPSCTPCVPNTAAGCGSSIPYCRRQAFAPVCIQKEVFVGFELTGTGGVKTYHWTASSLPPGLAVNQFGERFMIVGTPTAGTAATYNPIVTLNDSGQPPAPMTATYPILISNPPPPVVNPMPVLLGATVNQPFSYTFTATAGLPPYSNWKETGTLPAAIAPLTSGGVLAGTPTMKGSFPITVTVEDSLGQVSAAQGFNLQVYAHGFGATGSMATARVAATATLLNTGKVLVAGGTDPSGKALASAELFDPAIGTFSATGSMATARDNFAAALLPSGKVLVAGGLDSSGNPLASAEVYDPAAGTFLPTTGSMVIARASHTATLLNTGKVLIAGWGNAIAELFDPSAGTFTQTGSMVLARTSHTATLLSDGRVLIAGGIGASQQMLAEAELYNPASGSFSQTLGSLATGRDWHTATLLKDGTVLVTGGLDSTGKATATAELFNLTNQSFTPAKGNMGTPRAFQTAGLLKDGTVLVTGGNDGTSTIATTEVYDPTAGTFSPTGSMVSTRQSHTATLLNDGTVLVTGGTNGTALATAELYK